MQAVAEKKRLKEQREKDEADRIRREEEARWANVPEWKKKVLEQQRKKREVSCGD